MATKYAAGKWAIAECDRCGQRYKLKQLKKLVIKTKQVSIKVCPSCWDPDHPQLQLGMFPVFDPQALREPRPDTSYQSAGLNVNGNQTDGSRIYQWGFNPVGGASANDIGLTPNYLVATTDVGTVTITVSQEIEMARGDGVASKGKTQCKNFGNDGPKKGQDGDVAKGNKAKTVSSEAMKSMGRNMARAKNQGGK